jgi:hypothetical protein
MVDIIFPTGISKLNISKYFIKLRYDYNSYYNSIDECINKIIKDNVDNLKNLKKLR